MNKFIEAAEAEIKRRYAQIERDRVAARCPVAERIAAANQPAKPGYGFEGFFDIMGDLMSSRAAKRKAAETIIHLRRNRAALKSMGRDPHAADETLLARAAFYRRRAAELKAMGE